MKICELEIDEEAEYTDVISTAINQVGYDADTDELFIEFEQGIMYSYDEVDEDLYDEFVRAPSKGQFFHAYVKDFYPYTRLN